MGKLRLAYHAQACILSLFLATFTISTYAQDPSAQSTKPADRLLGSITTTDVEAHRLTVKEDSSGIEYTVSLGATKTFLKVPPGEKDLKKASRIDASQLAVGDRVAIRGRKTEPDAHSIEAASVLVMTASELQQKHQTELADWKQRGTVGLVGSLDPSLQKLTMTTRGAEGPKTYTADLSKVAEFTRFSPESPKVPAPSKLSDIQPGDQIRVLGNRDDTTSTIAAEKVYSGSFRNISATILSNAPDGKELTVADLTSKQSIKVVLTEDSSIHKLPPEMAAMLAARETPGARSQVAAGTSANPAAPLSAGSQPPAAGHAADLATPRPRRGGDLSQMVERLPKIPSSDLKTGDAVVISAAAATDKTRIIALTVVAGVEPLFRSGTAASGRASGGGDWNLGLSIPEQ